MPSSSVDPSPLAGFSRWEHSRLAQFCELLSGASPEGKAARDAFLQMPPGAQQRFTNRVSEALRGGHLDGKPALAVANLSDPFAPTACNNLGYEVLRWARRRDKPDILAQAICYLNTACVEEVRNPCTKIEAYHRAFDAAVEKYNQERPPHVSINRGVLRRIEALLPYAEHFLELIEERKRWDLASIWLPVFKATQEWREKRHISSEADSGLSHRITAVEEKLRQAPHDRTISDVVLRDINALLQDAAAARRERDYANAELMLASAMRYLGCSERGGNGLYAPRATLPLLVQVAIDRVETLLEASQQQFHSETEENDKAVALQLCQDLAQLQFSRLKLPQVLRGAIAELTSRRDLLDWFTNQTTGPDLSPWEESE